MQIITEIQIALPTRLQLTLHKGFSTRPDQVASFEESGEAVPSDIPSFLPLGRRLQAGPGKRSPPIGSNRPEARQGPCPTGPSNALVDCFRIVRDPGFEHTAKGWQQQVRFERRFIQSIRYTSASLNECSGQEDSCTSTPKRSAMQPP